MKFMKLGSKPDAFKAEGNSIRFFSSELETDIVIKVGEVKFYLHKFPLLAKSNCLQRLIHKANEENFGEISLEDCPGGPKAFEICAKFCYGVMVTLNPYNVVAVRCAAEYLEMTEEIDKGNLIFKIEVFLNSGIFRSWKDSILVLQTTKSLLPWSEDLKVVSRCIDSIASKTSMDPSNITWSYSYNRKLSNQLKITENDMKSQEKLGSVPNDWWVEDICELDIDLYKRLMFAVKSKGRMDGSLIGEALRTYVVRWLPDSFDALASEIQNIRYRALVEMVICLLPPDKGEGQACSCCFLLKLLKVAMLVGADDSSKEHLIGRVAPKLNEATVNDLLIPARSSQTTIYDIELVQYLVNQFVIHGKIAQDVDFAEKNEKNNDFVAGDESWFKFGKLIDGYLGEVARDPNVTLSSFIGLSQSIPDSARPIHDGLYWAIVTYLKEHQTSPKSEKKRLCGLMNVKKLSLDVSMHAAQNDQLPLRVVVQVLFFGQLKAAVAAAGATNNSISYNASHSTENEESDWGMTKLEKCNSLTKTASQVMAANEEDHQKDRKLIKAASNKSKGNGVQLLHSRSRRIFDKICAAGRAHVENQSTDTSGSSRSPSSMIQGEMKSPCSLRLGRRSIS